MKWIIKDKKFQQSCHLNLKKIIYTLGKFQCTSLINSSFDDVLFFIFYFLSPHFYYFGDKCNVVISKDHYESIIFLEFIQNLNDDSH